MPHFLGRLVFIGFLNLLLSGDNALVIALAVRTLPPRKRLLGQMWGPSVRGGSCAWSSWRWWRFCCACRSSSWREDCCSLDRPEARAAPERTSTGSVRHGASLWGAIWIIIVADVTMSLDNVLAIAAAAHGDMVLITLGSPFHSPSSSGAPDCSPDS